VTSPPSPPWLLRSGTTTLLGRWASLCDEGRNMSEAAAAAAARTWLGRLGSSSDCQTHGHEQCGQLSSTTSKWYSGRHAKGHWVWLLHFCCCCCCVCVRLCLKCLLQAFLSPNRRTVTHPLLTCTPQAASPVQAAYKVPQPRSCSCHPQSAHGRTQGPALPLPGAWPVTQVYCAAG
jgi:hypothetical protein